MRKVVELGTLTGGHTAGPKARTLDALLRAGFSVPPGVVLTAGTQPPTDAELDALLWAVADLGMELGIELGRSDGTGGWAVRSSAAVEDIGDGAAAGRSVTVLNVWGEGPLRAAVAESAATAAGMPMAVLVQRMVAALASGVACTADPVTGATGETQVFAVPGLGDRHVSGEMTPDEWVVTGDDVRHCGAAAGVLDEGGARAVARLARSVADQLGRPQDIEWALDGQGLHVLAARPITTLVVPVAMRVDPPPGFWRRGVAHGPSPRTPMTRSVFDENVGTVVAAEEFGFMVELRTAEIGGWHYAGVQAVGAPPGGTAPPAWLLGVLVRLSPPARRRMRRCREADRTDLADRVVRRWYSEVRPGFEARIEGLRDTDLPGLDDGDLARHLEAAAQLVRDGLREHFLVGTPHMLALAELACCCRELLGWSEAEMFALVAGTSTKTSEPARALAGLDRDAPGFATALADYQRTYGCRALEIEVAQPTLAECPGLALALLDEQRARGYDPDAEAADHTARRAAAADHAREGLRPVDRARFDRLLDRALLAYPLREENVFYTVDAPLALVRYGVLEAGRRLSGLGLVAAVPDVFFCELPEVLALLRGAREASPVRRRRGEHAWALAHPGPPSYGADPGPPPSMRFLPRPVRRAADAMMWAGRHIAADGPSHRVLPADDRRLTGVAASPGRYRGTVRVIGSEAELGRLRSGDVLVCPATRPSWSVIFASVGAVVTDSGGTLSHPAIIAREHRIPAVVATGCGTAVLRDGDIVTVDGTAGVVHIEY